MIKVIKIYEDRFYNIINLVVENNGITDVINAVNTAVEHVYHYDIPKELELNENDTLYSFLDNTIKEFYEL